jgi:predicted NACHT family NTPase
LVVIGAPGCGKTTLLKHVLLTFANNRQWRHGMRARVPFFVEVREVAKLRQASNEPTLPKLLETALRKDRTTADLARKVPKGWLEKTLRSGKFILLWDGLDEVADAEERRAVAAWLDRAIESPEYRHNTSIVTARPAGYLGATLDLAQVLEVEPFAFEDTKRFISRWYHATEVVSSGNKDNKAVRRRASVEADALLDALTDHPRIGDLTSNPLLLTMICMVHRYHGALPGSRGQLYAEICQVLLERWRQQRGVTDAHSANQKLQVLRPLAARMMDDQIKEVSTGRLLEVIADPLGRIGVAPGRESALAFLKQLQEGSGLLLERELDTWGFAHLSFQEYL